MQRPFKPHPPAPRLPEPTPSTRGLGTSFPVRSASIRDASEDEETPVRLAPRNSLPVLGPVESSHGAEAAPPTPPSPGPREAHGLPQRRRCRRRQRPRPRPWEQSRDAARNVQLHRRRTDAKTHALYGRLRPHVFATTCVITHGRPLPDAPGPSGLRGGETAWLISRRSSHGPRGGWGGP